MVRRDQNKIQTDTVVLTFDSPKPPSRIRAGYLSLDVRPYVLLPMRCYKCQRYGHSKDRCKKSAALCVRCGKGGHLERDCSANLHCVNCKGDHAASSKSFPKLLRYKAENGGTFQQARKAVAVEIHKQIFLDNPRIKLAFHYLLKLNSLSQNPCHDIIFDAPEPNLFANTFQHVKNATVNLNTIDIQYVRCFPPWDEHQVDFDISLTKTKKEHTSDVAYQKEFYRKKNFQTIMLLILTALNWRKRLRAHPIFRNDRTARRQLA
ncbi:nucleic-acid-binding protein from mobile element jockey [Plakobranchus ocellatus]|uniref:Nucleic-acid-binding protein from mobile element jockey n=1 Tax=Plakobranchus ocellatus TaxID=259542 RepID=A0AAV4AGD8_9GAST|nr:nucleic-acid-binding protein from mobile element jockey [Plakobranchus ocellatus]